MEKRVSDAATGFPLDFELLCAIARLPVAQPFPASINELEFLILDTIHQLLVSISSNDMLLVVYYSCKLIGILGYLSYGRFDCDSTLTRPLMAELEPALNQCIQALIKFISLQG